MGCFERDVNWMPFLFEDPIIPFAYWPAYRNRNVNLSIPCGRFGWLSEHWAADRHLARFSMWDRERENKRSFLDRRECRRARTLHSLWAPSYWRSLLGLAQDTTAFLFWLLCEQLITIERPRNATVWNVTINQRYEMKPPLNHGAVSVNCLKNGLFKNNPRSSDLPQDRSSNDREADGRTVFETE
jgi:hypothetical protein